MKFTGHESFLAPPNKAPAPNRRPYFAFAVLARIGICGAKLT